jgi:hypothetical protein
MNGEKISSDIILFKKSFTDDECEYIINTIETYPAWEEATTFGKIENYRKTKVDYLVKRYGINSQLFKAHSIIGYNFKVAFESLMNFYKKNENESHLFYTSDEGVQILKYEPGEYYHEHIDSGPQVKRIHSCVMFLNDEYEGGEISFPRQELDFKGETGDIIFFPSNFTHPHIAKEVKSGVKYTAIMWSC